MKARLRGVTYSRNEKSSRDSNKPLAIPSSCDATISSLVPFQLFAPNSLLGHPTANRRLFGPNLSPDQVGTALAANRARGAGVPRELDPALYKALGGGQ